MKKLIVFLGLVAVVFGLSFYLKMNKGSVEQDINVVIYDEIKSFDPAVAFNDDSLLVMGQSLETLYQYHYLKRPFEAIPLLAKGLPEVSEDGRRYTIRIKENIFYHNHKKLLPKDRAVKAQDFVWQIKRLAFKSVKSNGAWLFEGKIKGFKYEGSRTWKFLRADLEKWVKMQSQL